MKSNIDEELHGRALGWICPQCGRVHAPFVMECFYCNDKLKSNEIKLDPCIITPPWESDYSKYKSEVGTIHISPGISSGITVTYDPNVELRDERLRYTTSREFNSEYSTYTLSQEQLQENIDEFNTNLDRSIHKYSSQEQLQESLDELNKELENFGAQPTNLDELNNTKNILNQDSNDELWPTEQEVKDHLKYIKEQTEAEKNIIDDDVSYWKCSRCSKIHLVFPEDGCECGAPLEYLTYVV
jgi:uncharacterized OB-fold protein